jgi:acylphosphatase
LTQLVCRRFLVSGRVQGVFYRASTVREARRLGLSGSATNLADGRVEVVASGVCSKVEALATWLASGPPMAKVTDIVVQNLECADQPDWDGFKVG